MVTLAEIRLQARDRADMLDSTFVEDSELNTYINNSLTELHDLLIAAYNEEYVMEEVQFTSTENQIDYDLPNGTNYDAAQKFYKLRGVDSKINNDSWQTVKRFNFNKRNAQETGVLWNFGGGAFLEYRLVGSKIRFSRVPDTNTTFRVWYYPKCVVLVNDDDTYDDINGFIEYVVLDAAIKMLQKEESDVAVLMQQKQDMKDRIKVMAQDRDANEPESVSDIYAEDSDTRWFTGN